MNENLFVPYIKYLYIFIDRPQVAQWQAATVSLSVNGFLWYK